MSFRDPLSYKPEDIHEVMQIPITVDIGHHRSPRVIESIDGIITGATVTSNPTMRRLMVDTLTIETTNGEIRTVNIRTIKQFRERA